MFPSLQAKLARYEELERQLADPAVIADTPRYLPLQREHGGLAKIAKMMRRFNALVEEVKTAQEMVREEQDPDSKAYAEQELAELSAQYAALETELEDILTAGDAATRD